MLADRLRLTKWRCGAVPKRVDVAIIGGGPCGLATAHALSRVLPASASIAVLERAPSLELPRGAGLGMEVNGLKALEAINPDVYRTILAKHSSSMGTLEVRNHHGEPVKMLDVLARLVANREKYGKTEVQLGWHELVTTLAETLPPQVSLHTSRRFLKYELLDVDIDHSSDASAPAVSIQLQRAGAPAPDAPVTSRATDQSQLEEGEEVVTASLLVAADGYFSRVRQQCLADGPPDYVGAVVWRARVEAAEAARFGYAAGQAVNYVAPNRLLLIYMAGHGHVVWTASCTDAALQQAGINWHEVSESRAGTDNLERTRSKGIASKERLLKVFGDFEAPVRDLFAATPPESVLEHGVYLRPAAQLSAQSFGKGRVVIVGDAAHPMRPTGQGTNQALEDALLLARYVRQDGGGFGQLDAFRAHRADRLRPIMLHAEVQGRISYRADTERPVGAGVTVEPASAALAQGLLEDYDRVVYEGEDFSPL